LVMLELALVRWALEKLRGEGFEPVIPPVLVRERALFGTGFLPDTEQQLYALPEEELYLVGTSEVALASLHDGEILDAELLPRRYRELTSCSNTTDFQARRLGIRMRRGRGGTHTPHTLNGTAVAVGRTIVALLENGQDADGAVALPEVLVPYGAPARLEAASS